MRLDFLVCTISLSATLHGGSPLRHGPVPDRGFTGFCGTGLFCLFSNRIFCSGISARPGLCEFSFSTARRGLVWLGVARLGSDHVVPKPSGRHLKTTIAERKVLAQTNACPEMCKHWRACRAAPTYAGRYLYKVLQDLY